MEIDGSLPSLHDDHSCVGILWKRNQVLSQKSNSAKRKCSSIVGAAISSVIDIHDQPHKNGSFFFGYPTDDEKVLRATLPNHLTPVNNSFKGNLNSKISICMYKHVHAYVCKNMHVHTYVCRSIFICIYNTEV